MLRSINIYKILILVLTALLTLILFNQVVNRTALTTAQAATESLDCVTGANGIKGNGCRGTVKLKLGPGGVINSSTGYGLRVNKTNPGSGAALFAKNGTGGILTSAANAAIIGETNQNLAIYGAAFGGIGIYGSSINGTGIEGHSETGWAMDANGPTTQVIYEGGWIKALLRFSGGTINRCYNSQQTVPDHLPPCGFTLTRHAAGDYSIDFGFEVDNRYVSVTPEWAGGSLVSPVIYFDSTNVLHVQTYSAGTTKVESALMVIVY